MQLTRTLYGKLSGVTEIGTKAQAQPDVKKTQTQQGPTMHPVFPSVEIGAQEVLSVDFMMKNVRGVEGSALTLLGSIKHLKTAL